MPVLNESPFTATCAFEARATQGVHEVMSTAGWNTGGYELRVTQEIEFMPLASDTDAGHAAEASAFLAGVIHLPVSADTVSAADSGVRPFSADTVSAVDGGESVH